MIIIIRLMVISCGIIGVAWYYVWQDYQHFLETPITINQNSLFEIKSGQSVKTIAKQLQRQQIITKPYYWELLVRLENKTSRLQVGQYQLTHGLTPMQILDVMTSGKVIQYTLTLVEGRTFQQMMQMIRQHPMLTQTLQNQTPEQIMVKLGHGNQHPEGLFYPDTYHFPKGLTDLAFLRRAYNLMQEKLSDAWQQREAGLPYKTAYEALIMASIIEKETARREEQAEIAGVFVRRLQKNMRLQTDPTVIYGMGDRYHGNIRRTDLRKDTPYNTYTRKGLPPTPIAMPSVAAIHAALHPAQGNSLYFVAKGNSGWHYFSSTLAEHNRAVRKYQLKK